MFVPSFVLFLTLFSVQGLVIDFPGHPRSLASNSTIAYPPHNRSLSVIAGSGYDWRTRSYMDSVKAPGVHTQSRHKRQDGPTPTVNDDFNLQPTPAPTASGSPDTTVFIDDQNTFAILLPATPGELVSDAESDGVAYCTQSVDSGCSHVLPDGFITAASVTEASDHSWIQVTGCFDSSKFPFASSDSGGQFDVRFPNGAQCAFGGYGASFIEQVEPDANRFCLRCCASANDQQNCNSHQDTAGCVVAVPGIYDFPGVSCS